MWICLQLCAAGIDCIKFSNYTYVCPNLLATLCMLIRVQGMVSAFSDELKIGYGKFDEGSDINENHMTEITYVYDGKNLPYGLQPIAGALEHGSDKSGSDAYMIYAGVQKKFKYKK